MIPVMEPQEVKMESEKVGKRYILRGWSLSTDALNVSSVNS